MSQHNALILWLEVQMGGPSWSGPKIPRMYYLESGKLNQDDYKVLTTLLTTINALPDPTMYVWRHTSNGITTAVNKGLPDNDATRNLVRILTQLAWSTTDFKDDGADARRSGLASMMFNEYDSRRNHLGFERIDAVRTGRIRANGVLNFAQLQVCIASTEETSGYVKAGLERPVIPGRGDAKESKGETKQFADQRSAIPVRMGSPVRSGGAVEDLGITIAPRVLAPNASTDEVFDLIDGKYITTVYNPLVQRVASLSQDGDFDKFGGLPSVAGGFHWPVCEYCNLDMQYFFQLTEPTGARRTLQLFACINENCPNLHEDGTYRINVIDYKTHKMANAAIFMTQAKYKEIVSTTYSYNISDQAYHEGWRDGTFQHPLPFQCFRVVQWVPDREIAVSMERFVEYLTANKLIPQDVLDGYPAYQASNPGFMGQMKYYLDGVYGQLYDSVGPGTEVTFGGMGASAQNIDYSQYPLHFTDTYYIPYMWGDAGYAHMSSNNLAYDSH